MLLATLLALAAHAGPDVEVAPGGGLFSPLRAPHHPGLTTDVQADAYNLIEQVPDLGVVGGLQVGFYPAYGCPAGSCPAGWGVGRLGVGPSYRLPPVDLALLARLVRFGSSGPLYVDPAVQATFHVPAGDMDLRPFVGLENLHSTDVQVGVRIAVVDTEPDHTRTRTRQCTDGDTRTLDDPVQVVSFRGAKTPGPDEVDFDYGDAYLNEEMRNGLKDMKDLMGKGLAVMGSLQSIHNLQTGQHTLADAAGRTQDAVQLGAGFTELANQHDITDWSIPFTPADLPTAMASNWTELGIRAIDALIPKLKAHRERFLFGATVHYTMRTTTFECVPHQVCKDGWWQDEGWVVRGEPRHEDRAFTHPVRVPEARTREGEILGVWHMVQSWYSRLGYEQHDEFANSTDPCAMSKSFDPGVEVDSGPGQEDCEKWLGERNALDHERRALVGSHLDFLSEQLDWEQDQARQDCEDAQEMANFYANSASKWAEIAKISGSSGSADLAADGQAQADRYNKQATDKCDHANKVGEALNDVNGDIAGRPDRIGEIDREMAELDAKIAECNLLE